MAKAQFKGSYKGNNFQILVDVNLLIWEEDGTHFVFAPALDLTGYDNTEEGAVKSFEHMLDTTLKYMEHKDSLFDELERLGWTVNRKKKRVNAPNISELMEDNAEFKNLYNRADVRRESREVKLALA
ncbi:hypothetical protein BH11BAC7_BH11BAC7_34810 [soil metagenome]